MLKYKQIVNYIIKNIENGVFKVQKPLPTIRDLAQVFDCSKSTVVRAYSELQKENIIYVIPQSGYFLIDRKTSQNFDLDDINFSMAIPDRKIFPYQDFQDCIFEAANKYKDVLFRYNNSKGLSLLCSDLVKQLENYQVFTTIKNLFITNGSQQAIHILCNIDFPNNKNNILVEEPTYTGILKILKWKKIPAYTIKRDFTGLDMNELEKIFKYKNIKFFYTTTRFHNPLGTSLMLEQKRKICSLAKKYDVYIVEDDYLGELHLKNDIPLYYEDTSNHVIYIKSFSKIILPELRLAAVVLPDKLINNFSQYRNNMDLGTSLLLQGALEIYFSSGMFDIHRKKSRRIYKKKMNIIKKYSFQHEDGLIWHIPNTGYFCCIETKSKININKVINQLKKEKILLGNIQDNFLYERNVQNVIKLCISSLPEKDILYGLDKILKQIQKYKI